jgi:hypothetical protein
MVGWQPSRFFAPSYFFVVARVLNVPGGDGLNNHPKQDKLSVNWKKLDLNYKKNTLPQDYQSV